MSKCAGIIFATLIICAPVFAPSGFAQTPLPPQVSQTFSPTNIPQTGTTVLTITLSNPNTDVALNNISFDDVLPGTGEGAARWVRFLRWHFLEYPYRG